jgi:glycosyltransferase involved in cell wall biosynthesis
MIKATAIMPIRNEEKYIRNCLDSLLLQDIPQENIEYFLVDGMSLDSTRLIINEYEEKYPGLFRLIENPSKTTPHAMNIGIEEAKGKYIIRLDAHAEYSFDYLSKCIEYLEKTGADNVGGPAIATGRTIFGEANANIQMCSFGLGGGKFRTPDYEGDVDTVFLGAFRKETLQSLGGYDLRLTRNQDIELNSRIRKIGGRVFLTPHIRVKYFCRDSLWGLSKQNYDNGKWNIYTTKISQSALSLRHFIPLIFVVSIFLLTIAMICSVPFSNLLLLFELSLYFVTMFYFTLSLCHKTTFKWFLLFILIFITIHISYGIGSLSGLFTVNKFKTKNEGIK